MCRVFLGFAKAFVRSQQQSFGFFNEVDNSFTFPTLNSAYDYCVGPDMTTADRAECRNDDLDSMSAFLGQALGDSSAMGGLWELDFSSN